MGSPFWYRRISEISLLVDAIILALFLGSFLGLGKSSLLAIDPIVAMLAGASLAVALVSILIIKDQKLVIFTAVNYLLLSAALLALIATSGGLLSPYIALWMLVAAFAGLFGTFSIIGAAIAVNGLLGYLLLTASRPVASDTLMMFVLAVDLPLLVSYIIWHKKKEAASQQENEVKSLNQQLSKVAGESAVVIEAIADGVLSLDEMGSIHLFNPASEKLTGWPQVEAMGLDYKSVILLETAHGKKIEGSEHPIEQVRLNRQVVINNDLFLVPKSGEKIMVSLVVSPVMHEATLLGIILVFRDITKEKAEDKQQAEFISTASHEMRTPVAAIEGYLSLALNPKTGSVDNRSRDYLEKALANVHHLGQLFKDLLTITRSEDGRMDQNLQITNLISYTQVVVEGLQTLAIQKGLSLVYIPTTNSHDHSDRIMSPIFFANIDRDHFREVVANLVENAIKYTPNGSVEVNVDGDGDNVRISIKDSGLGVPEADLSHLFEKFYRVDSTDTREIGGTGLGLYICKRLIESMKGRIWAESIHGKGSTFSIELPRLSSVSLQQMQDSRLIEAVQQQVNSSVPLQSFVAPNPAQTPINVPQGATSPGFPEPIQSVFSTNSSNVPSVAPRATSNVVVPVRSATIPSNDTRA